MQTVKINREALYQMVWKEPITKVAKRYGFSGIGLAKMFKQHNVGAFVWMVES